MTAVLSTPRRRIVWRWRVVDIVVGAVLAVALGVVFFGWDQLYNGVLQPLVQALLPGTQSLFSGVWLIAAVLGGLLIRKPGAALFVELVASTVETLIGTSWGPLNLLSGLLQGLGAELVLAATLYASSRLWVAILAGAASGLGGTVNDLIVWYPGSSAVFAVTYGACFVLSGAVLGGAVSWLILRALAPTGAIDRFPAGRRAERI